MTTLGPLHDVRDPEAFCNTIIRKVAGRNGGHFTREDREDVLQFLLLTMWELAQIYETDRSTITFSTYATWILTRRIVDWYRDNLVDTRYSNGRPAVLSLDELRERLDRHSAIEERDDSAARDQADKLTRLALATTAVEVSPLELLETWRAHLTPQEATA